MNVSSEPPGGNLSCPEYSEDDFIFLDAFSFWVEGVLQVGYFKINIKRAFRDRAKCNVNFEITYQLDYPYHFLTAFFLGH